MGVKKNAAGVTTALAVKKYRTAEVARIIGVHVNTVRLYESCGFISVPERLENGYRVFTDIHLEQLRLARTALRVEVLQNGLRKKAVEIIKASGAGDYELAEQLTEKYMAQLSREKENAEEAIIIARGILNCEDLHNEDTRYKRREAADYLGVTIDTLRNWELNGLFSVKRLQNGYRIYTAEDMKRLKLIRSLRCANYSLSSILRMLSALSYDPKANIRKAIDTPKEGDDIITACDKLLTSLGDAMENGVYVKGQINKLKELSHSVIANSGNCIELN